VRQSLADLHNTSIPCLTALPGSRRFAAYPLEAPKIQFHFLDKISSRLICQHQLLQLNHVPSQKAEHQLMFRFIRWSFQITFAPFMETLSNQSFSRVAFYREVWKKVAVVSDEFLHELDEPRVLPEDPVRYPVEISNLQTPAVPQTW
jgi:hypothetical protein